MCYSIVQFLVFIVFINRLQSIINIRCDKQLLNKLSGNHFTVYYR